jgi:hypothetical protein
MKFSLLDPVLDPISPRRGRTGRDGIGRRGRAPSRFRLQFRTLRDCVASRKTAVPAFLNRALMQVTSLPSRFGGCLTRMLLIEKVGVRIDGFGPPLPAKSMT